MSKQPQILLSRTTAAQPITQTDPIKDWANGTVRGVIDPKYAADQLIIAIDLRNATTFEEFSRELRLYSRASQNIYKAYEKQSASTRNAAFDLDSANASTHTTQIFLNALDNKNNNTLYSILDSKPPAPINAINTSIPFVVLQKIQDAYLSASGKIGRGIKENNFLTEKDTFLKQLTNIRAKVEADFAKALPNSTGIGGSSSYTSHSRR